MSREPSSSFCDLGGPVHFLEWAGPPASPIVCLHAVGGSALLWRGVAPALAAHGRVLALDQAGFGETPRAGRSAAVEPAHQLLSRFLRATSARPAVLVGHSMGGAVALLQAAREPGSVRGLVLSSSLLPAAFEGASDRAAVARYLRLRAEMRARAARRSLTRRPTLERVVADGLRGAAAEPDAVDDLLIEDSLALVRAGGRRESAAAFAQAARSTFALVTRPRRFRQVLDRVECPVLVLHGGRDRTIPLAFAQRAVRDHPGWRLEVFPELGHMLQLEDPAGWSSAVGRWLAECER
ncbi:MAG TPA: alpha/beta fold hydrolase [Gaiellales bacterium]